MEGKVGELKGEVEKGKGKGRKNRRVEKKSIHLYEGRGDKTRKEEGEGRKS